MNISTHSIKLSKCTVFPIITGIATASEKIHFQPYCSYRILQLAVIPDCLTKFHNFKPLMHQQSHIKCAEVTHWLKKHVYILWEFSIFLGDSNQVVLPQKQDPRKHFMCKFTPVLFYELYEYFLVQIAYSGCWRIFLSNF